MDILNLIFALSLPWLGCYCWLAALETKANKPSPHPMRQAGIAFFLGMALLSGLMLVQSRLTGGLSYWPIMGVLLLFTLAGAFAFSRTIITRFKASPENSTRIHTILFWIFTGWILLHFALLAVEILHRPVFPWDAWQSWMYRSKAWFYSGNLVPLDGAMQWNQGRITAQYSMPGHSYPIFVSAIAYWAALALGQWNDVWINLPTLACGVALAMAFYGYCREAELPKWASALGVYLLISIPLMGSHLALAGQADIWQSAFTGLGLTALVWGIVKKRPWHMGLGLCFAMLGIAIKNEGLVWALVAILVLFASTRPRLAAACLAGVIVATSVAWVTGIHHLELSALGAIGFDQGRLHVPLLGSFRFEVFDLWEDYRANFFQSSTWHLLWPLLILLSFSLVAMPRGRLRRTIFVLFVTLLLSQLAIFAFTEQGRWAEDWTAINRLPMHMLPVLIFSLLLGFRELSPRCSPEQNSYVHWLAPATGLLLVTVLCIVYLRQALPATEGTGRDFNSSQLRLVAGAGHVDKGLGIITRFDNDIAVVSSGRLFADASSLSILRVTTGGENQQQRRFFWRRNADPQEIYSIDIGEGGTKLTNLAVSPEWSGKIIEVGILFHDDGGKRANFESLSLRPRTLNALLKLTWDDWTTLSKWSQKSAHHLPAGAESTPLKLPVVAAAWLLATTLIALLLIRFNPNPLVAIGACVIVAWIVLDLRWTTNLISQAKATASYYQEQTSAHLDVGQDRELHEFAVIATEHLHDLSTPVYIVSEDAESDFEALRLKYHLMPIAAHVKKGASLSTMPRTMASSVIVVRPPYLAPGLQPVSARDYASIVGKHLKNKYRVVFDSETAVILMREP